MKEKVAAPAIGALGMPAAKRYSLSLWKDAAARFSRNRLALVGLAGVVGLTILALGADWLAPTGYATANYAEPWKFPSLRYPMGTDGLGRDVLSRVIYGARVSMAVGVGAQLIAFAAGIPLGALAGLYGGRVDYAISRLVDLMSSFPRLLFVILVMAMLGSGLTNIFIAVGISGWIQVCRLTRAQFLAHKEKDFVLAARAIGASDLRIMVSHLLPNSLGPLIVFMTLGIPEAIFTEAGLSFLGFGVNPPTPSWGQMVGESIDYLRSFWHLALFPALLIALTMLSFTLTGDGLRDALDPTMRK